MQPAYGITTLSLTVGSSGASAPKFSFITMAPYTIRTTISFCSGGTGYVWGAGITTTVGYPGLTLGVLINNSTGLVIDGPAAFYLSELGATSQISIVRELSPGFT